jgi:endonuclease-8
VLCRLGPDLLSAVPNLEEAVARLRAVGRESVPIADALLDQRALAGIGNVYRSEVCFLERVDPITPLDALDDATLARVVATARRLLAANLHSPYRTTVEPDDGLSPGRRGGRLWVSGRTGCPCRRCGTAIRSLATGPLTRRVYWCPTCQLPLRPTRRTP